ncbi:MAG TPA: M56 family metallopeptidase [Acidimicrobiales bacterium]|nr:M56 family metallopeptidase [Acidimicrobiales bacterium]
MIVAAVLAGLCVGLFGPVPAVLARAGWVVRAPRAAVALWQAIGVAGSLSAVGAGLAVAVAPLHAGLVEGLHRLGDRALAGHPLAGLGLNEALGLTIATDVGLVLAGGLVVTLVRTVRHRARHREVLDLVCRRSDRVPGAVLLDHPDAVAYCLPGLRPRIVLSAGAVGALDQAELGAVVAHERGHVQARHHLVMLPLSSMVDLLHWMPYARLAPGAVAVLLEMAADDFATRTHGRRTVAAALVALASAGHGRVPRCAFAAAGTGVERRVHRLLAPTGHRRPTGVAALAAAAGVLALPLATVMASALLSR